MDAPGGAAGPELFTVNQLAEALGITPRAIRFYESKGLIAPRRVGAMRVFTRRDRARLLLVLRGIRLGFTLAEVKKYLDLYDIDPTQREQVRLLREKVAARIAALEAQRRDLDQALAELRDIAAQAEAALAAGDAAPASLPPASDDAAPAPPPLPPAANDATRRPAASRRQGGGGGRGAPA